MQDSRREAASESRVVPDWEVDPTEIDMKKSIPIGKVGARPIPVLESLTLATRTLLLQVPDAMLVSFSCFGYLRGRLAGSPRISRVRLGVVALMKAEESSGRKGRGKGGGGKKLERLILQVTPA